MKGGVAHDCTRPDLSGRRRGSRFNHRGRRKLFGQLKRGESLNPGKIILGVLTVIGLLADLIDDD